jgi:hypothetical protein
MKQLLFLFAFVGFTLIANGQNLRKSLEKQPQNVVYDKEASGFFRLHTNGYAIGMNYGKLKTYYRTTFWQGELVHLKHPREYVERLELAPSRPGAASGTFVFGKQNSFFALHGSYGEKRYFSGKADKQGVAVGMSFAVGPSLGIVKPYYLSLYRFGNNGLPVGTSEERYTEENASLFLNSNAIAGSAGFGYGFDELSLIPGGQGKIALHLDWGAFEEFVRAAEVGLMVDFYAKTVPIMLTEDNRPYFFNFYFALEFGKRW